MLWLVVVRVRIRVMNRVRVRVRVRVKSVGDLHSLGGDHLGVG